MKILKPNWVNHDGKPIYSIDIHPDGSRFATGGQGDDCGIIIIWNMGPIVHKEKEHDENTPKILSQMDHHMGIRIKCRKNNKRIRLYELWQKRLRQFDVLDLAWSPTDEYLASCSVDNTVIIWNTLNFPEILTRINAHSGFVKGVTWDPIGKYLASQSDDKTIKIWRTTDWSMEKVVDEPFKECGGTTHILRLNWSPDGQLLISAHAMNNGVPTAQIIERNAWRTKLDFVGHRKAVTVVKFYPQILKTPKANETEDIKTYCLCAVGSRDRSLSIWLTSFCRPISVMHDLFENPVMDITWSKEPIGLLCCSMDGTVAYLELSNDEIGHALDANELETFFKLKYAFDINESLSRKSLNDSIMKINGKNFIEDIGILIAQEKEQEQKQNSVHNPLVESDSQSCATKTSSSTENHKQIERRLPDGRRRITPICIAKTNEYETPKPFNMVDIKLQSQTATEQSTIIVEKRDEKDEIIEVSPIKSIQYTKQAQRVSITSINSNDGSITKQADANDNSKPSVTKSPVIDLKTKLQEQSTSLKDLSLAVKRPTSLTIKPQQSQQQQQQVTQQKSTQPSASQTKPTNQQVKTKSQPSTVPSKTSATSSSVAVSLPKAHQPTSQPKQNEQPNPTVSVDSDALDIDNDKTNRKQANFKTPKAFILNPLRFESNKTVKTISTRASNRPHVELEIENNFNNLKTLNYLRYKTNDSLKWKTIFNGSISAVAYSTVHIVCVTSERLVYFLTQSNGTHLCSPIIVDDHVTLLKCNQYFTACLTCNGSLYLWKYDPCMASSICTLINGQSCLAVLKDSKFIDLMLTDNGVPVIYTNNNSQTYYYSTQTQCFHLIPSYANNNDLILNSYLNDEKLIQNLGPLSLIQARDHTDNLKSIDKLNGKNSNPIKHDYTLMHIESQLNATIGLNSPKEYKFWLMTYVRYLCDNSYEDKLKELCSFLLGPLYSTKWNAQILNLNKHDLLQETLNIIAQNLNLQRLYTSYKHQLGLATSQKPTNDKKLPNAEQQLIYKQNEYEKKYSNKFNRNPNDLSKEQQTNELLEPVGIKHIEQAQLQQAEEHITDNLVESSSSSSLLVGNNNMQSQSETVPQITNIITQMDF